MANTGTGSFQLDNCCGCDADEAWLFFIVYQYVGLGFDNVADAMDSAAAVLAAADFDTPPVAWQDWANYSYGSCGFATPADPSTPRVVPKKWTVYDYNFDTEEYQWWDPAEYPFLTCPLPFQASSLEGSGASLGPVGCFITMGGISDSVFAQKAKLPNITTACVSTRTGTDFTTTPDPGLTVVDCGPVTEAGGIILDNVTSCDTTPGSWRAECAWVGGYEIDWTTPTCLDCTCP